MAGTLSYRLKVAHIYQRRFDSTSLGDALTSSHWYIITRRPSTRIVTESVRTEDQILTVDFATRDDLDSELQVYTFGSDFRKLGEINNFQAYSNEAYFSMRTAEGFFHGDAWTLGSLLSGANAKISGQEVLYIGQSFGSEGGRNTWERIQKHEKLQRIYEDHVGSDCEIFVAPLMLIHSTMESDDHIDDSESGPSLSAYLETFYGTNEELTKTAVDLIEHSLISYFAPPYNEKLKEWRASAPTGAMRKMRAAGFRLLNVHLDGWRGLARFYSSQSPNLLRSHFISQDIPPEPRRPVLRGIAADKMSDWRFGATLVREGKEVFANRAENSGTIMRVFGDEAPAIRKPPTIKFNQDNEDNKPAQSAERWASQNEGEHERIRSSIRAIRREEQEEEEGRKYSGKTSYDPNTGKIVVGEYSNGEAVQWQLVDPGTGSIKSGMIIGDQEVGKSSLLRLIMAQAIQSGKFFIFPADPTGRNNFRSLWNGIYEDRFIATDLEHTITNLEIVYRIIQIRRENNNYSRPSEDCPGIFLSIDDADIALIDDRGAYLVKQILSSGSEVGVGLLLVISNVSDLEENGELMRHLVACSNISAFSANGYGIVADLKARYGQPRMNTLRNGVITFIVHHSVKETTLGIVAAVTPHELTPSEAQDWYREYLGEHDIPIMDWIPIKDYSKSFFTLDLLRADRWFLRQHHDGWILIKVLSNQPCESRADALGWAMRIINFRFSTDLAPWQIGPSTEGEGILAYYADARGGIFAKDRSEEIKKFLFGFH